MSTKEITRRTPWMAEEIKSFKDDTGTMFIKGPFYVDGIEYDCKLKDKNGEDYCTYEQMIDWNVRMSSPVDVSHMTSM